MRVLHLAGSAVSDFLADLSFTYTRDSLATLGEDPRWTQHVAAVAPDGRWRFGPTLDDLGEPCPPARAIEEITALGIELVLPQMFCQPGMTSYRALFDVLGIPTVGNPPSAMALGAHKARARAVVAAAGVDVPRGEVVGPGRMPTLTPPVVVKPVDADNSVGVTLVPSSAEPSSELSAALDAAWEHSAQALVEEYVPLGREVRCGVIERDGELVGLPLEEYDVATVRGYADKISYSDSTVSLMAKGDRAWILPTTDPATAPVWELAFRCHRALGCRDYSLIDVRLDDAGRPWFLEASLYCSFARQSVLATMAGAAGITVTDLLAALARERMVGL